MDFKKKKDLKQYLSNILHNTSGRITDKKINDVLYELVSHSQNEKLSNFEYFEVDKDKFKSKCFYVCSKDGTREDFSYNWIIRCYDPLSIRNRLPNHIVLMQKAARWSINSQINKWRADNNIESNLVINHYPVPFSKILYDWYCEQNDIEIPLVRNKYNVKLIGPTYEKSWQYYHKKKATYRAITHSENSKNNNYDIKIDWYKAINDKKNKDLKSCRNCKLMQHIDEFKWTSKDGTRDKYVGSCNKCRESNKKTIYKKRMMQKEIEKAKKKNKNLLKFKDSDGEDELIEVIYPK
jgi:hypothetical protein